MDQWHWDEHFAGQPEILTYINHVVEKYDLRKDMQFDTRIVSAKFDESQRIWKLEDQNGKQYTCRWLIVPHSPATIHCVSGETATNELL